MNLAVNFDREANRETGEIQAEMAKRMLLAETQSARPGPQSAPQDHLRQVAALAFAASEFNGFSGRAKRGAAGGPSTMLRMVPLPVPGSY